MPELSRGGMTKPADAAFKISPYPFSPSPIITGASLDSRLCAYDLPTGEQLWSAKNWPPPR